MLPGAGEKHSLSWFSCFWLWQWLFWAMQNNGITKNRDVPITLGAYWGFDSTPSRYKGIYCTQAAAHYTGKLYRCSSPECSSACGHSPGWIPTAPNAIKRSIRKNVDQEAPVASTSEQVASLHIANKSIHHWLWKGLSAMASSQYISSSREEATSQIPPPEFGGHVLDMSNIWPSPPSHHHHPISSSFALLETKGILLPGKPWGWGFQSRVYSKHEFFSVSKYAVVTESQVDRWTACNLHWRLSNALPALAAEACEGQSEISLPFCRFYDSFPSPHMEETALLCPEKTRSATLPHTPPLTAPSLAFQDGG